MPAIVISGYEVREEILSQVKKETDEIRKKHGKVPGLATILVGDDPGSVSYVKLKIETAESLGFREVQVNLSKNTNEKELIDTIEKYNVDDNIHGILVQLPLPPHIDEKKIIYSINPEKDVDCFHPINVGKMVLGCSDSIFNPCTPAGIIELIKKTGIPLSGAEVAVIGRSNLVGKPLANMLLQKRNNATVTVLHTGSKDLEYHCRRADIVVAAAGSPGLVKPQWIRPGACVIDVGTNRIGERISSKTGKKIAVLKGDVDFEEISKIAGYITPVPGGVGPMTITMLMKNTLESLKKSLGLI
ncbi:MAG: tetrahydrofolate dehydrogenase/cyclohydrolase catalytic domain-containing protein [Spirochaetia bacterium]|jgi:methylenetetrahydrofolate dehydrogenase (NADP+)/methenyltetrahydrofolate cyclohydrolase|nr:tetrahydrofolate dehydrogenase/cyclohydrolase catalytic domain-containing protein [Spirochaetia bacterium]